MNSLARRASERSVTAAANMFNELGAYQILEHSRIRQHIGYSTVDTLAASARSSRSRVGLTKLFALSWLLLLLVPVFARADDGTAHSALDLPLWTVLPFAALLGCIALLPILHGPWWHHNRRKALVTFALSIPVLIHLAYLDRSHGLPALHLVGEKVLEYISFLSMLTSLYVVSGGILITGKLRCSPGANLGLLALGAVLANLIGTTGASILLIRPLLRANKRRLVNWHLPMFFIFVVSNTGGLLTPLGDPPLFLGFLDGVPFAWTLGLWKHWLFVNVIVLIIFYVWDVLAFRRGLQTDADFEVHPSPEPIGIRGFINLLLLAGIVGTVLLQGVLTGWQRELLPPALMLMLAILSLWLTPAGIRRTNAFTWEPIVEVAILFAGIFITMIPALAILGAKGSELGVSRPYEYFWLTGLLSSCLDNAPTYLTFGSLASNGHNLGWLAANELLLLQAISCGAVFMGALTYIGNGPNFMIKAIAEEAGYRTPSFFGYMGYAAAVLLPVFVLVTVVFLPSKVIGLNYPLAGSGQSGSSNPRETLYAQRRKSPGKVGHRSFGNSIRSADGHPFLHNGKTGAEIIYS